MNLQTMSLEGLRILLATMPASCSKEAEVKAEIEKREAAERWKLANEKALTILN